MVYSRVTGCAAVAIAAAFVALAAGCGAALQANGGEQQDLAALRVEIRELIGDAACDTTTDCRVIGMGAKPCGGPWGYLVYSTTATDSVQLTRLVSRYNAMEDSINRRAGLMSDCEHVQPPAVGCTRGRCMSLGAAPESRSRIP